MHLGHIERIRISYTDPTYVVETIGFDRSVVPVVETDQIGRAVQRAAGMRNMASLSQSRRVLISAQGMSVAHAKVIFRRIGVIDAVTKSDTDSAAA